MTTALYSITTRAAGSTLTANIYNTDHQNHVNNGIPTQLGHYSSNAAEMQTNTSPGTVGAESLATAMSGEFERLRFVLKYQTGGSQWYDLLASNDLIVWGTIF